MTLANKLDLVWVWHSNTWRLAAKDKSKYSFVDLSNWSTADKDEIIIGPPAGTVTPSPTGKPKWPQEYTDAAV
jgi:hypothetical protein